MTHQRLSVSALSSVQWSFDQDLALWQDLGLPWAGLMRAKLGEDVADPIARLSKAGIRVSTVVAQRFDLADPTSWAATRKDLHRLIDVVAEHGGWSVYLVPGRSAGAVWDDVLDTFAQAIGPSVAHAKDKGVRLAIEPSRRVEVSFVNNLRDAIDVAERTGIEIVADICNCWMERDLGELLLRAAPHIALVQLADVSLGTIRSADDPPSDGRVPFGEGELPLTRLLDYIRSTAYGGPLELELIGPMGDQEGYEPVVRRGVAAATMLLSEAGL